MRRRRHTNVASPALTASPPTEPSQVIFHLCQIGFAYSPFARTQAVPMSLQPKPRLNPSCQTLSMPLAICLRGIEGFTQVGKTLAWYHFWGIGQAVLRCKSDVGAKAITAHSSTNRAATEIDLRRVRHAGADCRASGRLAAQGVRLLCVLADGHPWSLSIRCYSSDAGPISLSDLFIIHPATLPSVKMERDPFRREAQSTSRP